MVFCFTLFLCIKQLLDNDADRFFIDFRKLSEIFHHELFCDGQNQRLIIKGIIKQAGWIDIEKFCNRVELSGWNSRNDSSLLV